NEAYDLLVLDAGLPGMGAFMTLQRLRQAKYKLPILILTARDSVEERVYGLSLGADDVLVKPFRPTELVGRIHTLLRRRLGQERRISFGELVLDFGARQAQVRGTALALTTGQWRMLELLARRAGEVVEKQLLRKAYSEVDKFVSENAVEVHI